MRYPTAGILLSSVRTIFLSATWLSDFALSLRERRVLGSLHFPGVFAFVDAVAEALQKEPALFSGYPVCGEELKGEQDLALAWRTARDAFGLLSKFCNDQYLYTQGSAIAKAFLVAEQTLALKNPSTTQDKRAFQRFLSLQVALQIYREQGAHRRVSQATLELLHSLRARLGRGPV